MTHDSTPFWFGLKVNRRGRSITACWLQRASRVPGLIGDNPGQGPLDNLRASQGLFSTEHSLQSTIQFEVDLLKSFAALFVTSTALRESGSSASECDSAQSTCSWRHGSTSSWFPDEEPKRFVSGWFRRIGSAEFTCLFCTTYEGH